MGSPAVRAAAQDIVEFCFHGVGLRIASSSHELLDNLARDFHFFAASAPARKVSIEANLARPPWERIPVQFAVRVTPNAVIYDRGSVRYNDYQHEALAIYDFASEQGEVWSENADLLYEVTYLLCLSRIGELHDLQRIHRVHALGIVIGEKAALVLLPESGGKSTLCMEMLLRRPEVRLLSDDTPLVSRGKLLAFPNRIGIRAAKGTGIDPRYLRTMRRRNREPKTLLDVSYFEDRIAAEARPYAIIVGARRNGDDSWIESISAARALPTLMANLTFGLGLPQVVEFFLRGGGIDALRKSSIAGYRCAAALGLIWRAKCYRLALGRDVAAAADAVISVLKK